MSPDGEAIVTGAGDETLRFWNVFSKMRSTKVLNLSISHLYLYLSLCHVPLSFSLPLLGICISPEPIHQDPVVRTPLYYEGGQEGNVSLHVSDCKWAPFFEYSPQ